LQNGNYWHHSHSGFQEQIGDLAPLIIEPTDGDIDADREHVILLCDWTFDGVKFDEVEGAIVSYYGERLRLILVNDTMMEHPIHLHYM